MMNSPLADLEAEPNMKRVAILQSSYIPWKGYFDLINSVDEFILYDDVQYTRQDWRNRNRIKTAHGTRWLTIPVKVDGLYQQRLDETIVADPAWARRHWDTLRQSYSRAARFGEFAPDIEAAYAACANEARLSAINRTFIEVICRLLRIGTTLRWSTDFDAHGASTERVVDLCRQSEAHVYLSGPRGRDYLDEKRFDDAGIELEYFDYEGYRIYEQPHPPFEHQVTVLDLLFATGHAAHSFMKTFGVVGSHG
jgi:WbqC-like protein family